MFYVKKQKVGELAADEYSMEVKAVADASVYLSEGWEEATYGEWFAVQSDEVKAHLSSPEVPLPSEVAQPEPTEATEPATEDQSVSEEDLALTEEEKQQ